MHINDLLKIAVERKASDLHLKVSAFPVIRVDGRSTPLSDMRRLMQEDTIAMAFSIMSARQKEKFKNNFEIDIAYSVPNLGTLPLQHLPAAGDRGPRPARHPGARSSRFADLLLPPVLEKICQEQRGLVLCTGTTGSGKSTTLAAMIDHINSPRNEHIVTVEDPIEFLHRDKKSIVNQREVEVDTKGFSVALRSALRQDPDVILVGEMRDYETIETALTAAETGHLVFSTLHTLDATETINRIISVFPPHQQKQIRLQLGAVLKAVISLRLMPRADGLGRVPAAEILIRTYYVRECIENKEKTKYIKDAIQAGTSQYGMQTFDQSLYQPLQVGPDHARGGPEAGDQPQRVQAQDPGHPVDRGHRARGDGLGAGGSLRLQPAPGGVSLRLLQPAPGPRFDGPDAAERRHPLEPDSAAAARERALRLLAIRPRGRGELARALDGAGIREARPQAAAASARGRRAGSTTSRPRRSAVRIARRPLRPLPASSGSSRPAGFDRETVAAAHLGGRLRRTGRRGARRALRGFGGSRGSAAPAAPERISDALTRRGFRAEKISEMIRGSYEVD